MHRLAAALGLLAPAALTMLLIPPAAAQFAEPKLVGHLAPRANLVGACGEFPTTFDCNNGAVSPPEAMVLNVQGDVGTDYALFIMAADLDTLPGIQEVRFGLTYNDTSGVDVIDWQSCADEVIPGPGWPASGSTITLRFTAGTGCRLPIRNPADIGRHGSVPLAVLLVRAHGPDLLGLSGADPGQVGFSDCLDQTGIFVSRSEFGFGFRLGFEPCTVNPFAHGCAVFFGCICCLPADRCRPIAPYYDERACHNEGGEVLYMNGDCNDCAVPVEPETWGGIKARVR